MSDSEKKTTLPESSIDPLKYLGRDLRELPNEEVETIIKNYGTLRNTADGYNLGQKVMALKAVRDGVKEVPGFQERLDDPKRWIFLGSKATQAKNQLGQSTRKI